LQTADKARDIGIRQRFLMVLKHRLLVPEVVLANPHSAGCFQFVLEAIPGTFAFVVSHPFGKRRRKDGAPGICDEAALDPFPLSQLRS
jgi:hypothetical protein